MAFFKEIGERIGERGQKAVKAVSDFVEVSKLKDEIVEEEKRMNELLQQLGIHCFDSLSEIEEEPVASLCAGIRDCRKNIDQMQREIQAAQNQKICSYCGGSCGADSVFCLHCGKRLEPENQKASFCSKCGSRTEENEVFCTGCGAKLEE